MSAGPLAASARTARVAEGALACRAPVLLTVHLKRFQVDSRSRTKKINGSVAFGLRLDATRWCDPEASLLLGRPQATRELAAAFFTSVVAGQIDCGRGDLV